MPMYLHPTLQVTFTLGDANSPSSSVWGDHFVALIRVHNAAQSYTDKTTYGRVVQGQQLASTFGNGTSQTLSFGVVTPGQSYDLAFLMVDQQGNESAVVTDVSLQNYAVGVISDGHGIGTIIGRGHFIGDVTGDILNPVVDANGFKHGMMSGPTQGVIDAAGSLDVSAARSGKILPYANHDNSFQKGVFQKNLVVNGNNCSGTGAIPPTQYAWTTAFGGGSSLDSLGGFGPNNSYTAMRMVSSPTNGGFYQDIPCIAGQTYTFCCLVESTVANLNAGLWIGSADGAYTQYNGTPGVPSGSLGQFYTSSSSTSQNGWFVNTPLNQLVVLYGTFTVPTNAAINKMRVILYNSNGSVGGTSYFAGVMIIPGTRLQDYIDHELNAGSVNIDRHVVDGPTYGRPLLARLSGGKPWIDFSEAIHTNKNVDWIGDGTTYARVKATELSTGTVKQLNDGTITRTAANVAAVVGPDNKLPNSSAFTTQGSIPPVGIPGVTVTGSWATGTGQTPTVTVSWSAGSVLNADGSTVTFAAGSQAYANLTANTTYYFTVYGTTAGAVVINNGPSTSLTTTQKYSIYLDTHIPITNSAYGTTPSIQGGSGGGGGGGGGTCPSEDQVVRVKELGLVPAREYKAGMHLMGPDSKWKRILRVVHLPAQMMLVTCACCDETQEVDINHLWKTADDEWVRVTDLSLNHLLKSNDGKLHELSQIRKGVVKTMVKTCVDGGEFIVGANGLIGHNYGTL